MQTIRQPLDPEEIVALTERWAPDVWSERVCDTAGAVWWVVRVPSVQGTIQVYAERV